MDMREEWKEYFEKRLGDFKKDIIHQFHIISEDVITKVQQVAEGVVNLDQKFDRRLDGLDRNIDEKNQDVLAAIKFSYAELDRRITYLETELQALKQRVHQIEKRMTP
jgi:ABC-type phosphate transport system auxiliary subunit